MGLKLSILGHPNPTLSLRQCQGSFGDNWDLLLQWVTMWGNYNSIIGIDWDNRQSERDDLINSPYAHPASSVHRVYNHWIIPVVLKQRLSIQNKGCLKSWVESLYYLGLYWLQITETDLKYLKEKWGDFVLKGRECLIKSKVREANSSSSWHQGMAVH